MFYTWQEFCDKKPLVDKQRNMVKKACKKGKLGLASYLRNHGVHSGPLIFTISLNYDHDKTEKIFEIDLERIMDEKKIDGIYTDVKKMLNQNYKVDALALSKAFINEFIKLCQEIWLAIKPFYNECIANILKYIPDRKEPIYNFEIICEETNDEIPIGMILERINQKVSIIKQLVDIE